MEVKRPGTKFTVYQTGLKIRGRGEGGAVGRCRVCGSPTRGDLCRACELSGRMG
jgi:hypothetical protein